MPLPHILSTGDTVEILTTKGHTPSPDWLNFVKTVKAKTKIRQWINARERERSQSLGKEMCEKQFKKKGQNFNALVKSGVIIQVAETFGFKSVDDLIAHVGFGKLTPLQILNKAVPDLEKQKDKEESILKKIISGKRQKPSTGIIVKGLNDILVKFANCCSPLPGDNIVGFITQGQGVAIHRKNCFNVMKMSLERMIDVEWSQHSTDSYPASIRVQTNDRFGLLADVASAISKHKSNILNARTDTSDSGIGIFYFTIQVTSSDQLRSIMADVKKVKKVTDVKRIVAKRD